MSEFLWTEKDAVTIYVAADQVSWAVTRLEMGRGSELFMVTVVDPRDGSRMKFPETWKRKDEAIQFCEMGERRRLAGRFTVKELWQRMTY